MRGHNFMKCKYGGVKYKMYINFDTYSQKIFTTMNPWDNMIKTLVNNDKNFYRGEKKYGK